MEKIKTAFILGAGLGLRLRPLTENVPKPLLPVGGRPIITYAMDHLIAAGIERFIVNTHHRPAAYQAAFPEWLYRERPIIFRHEPVLLDTGGGLKNIEDLIEQDEAVIVYNGDIISNISIEGLFAARERLGGEACLALRSSGHLLNVELGEDGVISDMRGLLGRRGARRCQFTGIYTVERRFLRRLVKDRIESVVPAFVRLLEIDPRGVTGTVLDDGCWCDIGSIEEYEKVKDRK
jgi:NDP-sugar pyrophosphorylase family protein